jgi:hypothetical protein
MNCRHATTRLGSSQEAGRIPQGPTWFQGPKEDFIRVSQEGAARGVNILHFTGGCRITLAGSRAIAQTRMTIMQRGEVEGVLCDVACTGRFYDFLERRGGRGVGPPEPAEQREGRWGIVLRQLIYEKDRLDPVDPAASLVLNPELLARYPEGYRYLAYLQVQVGYPVRPDMPGLRGPQVEPELVVRQSSQAQRHRPPHSGSSERATCAAPAAPR